MRHPAGKNIAVGGVYYQADATGCVVVPEADIPECERHGFILAPDAPAPSESAAPPVAAVPRRRRAEGVA